MNITKDYLRKIIKEELANISIPDEHTAAIDALDKLILKKYKDDKIMNDLVQGLREIVTDYESSVEYSPDGDSYGSGPQKVEFTAVEEKFSDLKRHINNKGYKELLKKFMVINFTEKKPSKWYSQINGANIWGKPLLIIINRSFLVSQKKYKKIGPASVGRSI